MTPQEAREYQQRIKQEREELRDFIDRYSIGETVRQSREAYQECLPSHFRPK
ncbi:MAG: hypothetical protein KKF56_00760 [Nanoarchaeota archaeon]|nr:hypothetical protein [Nanoarchaeota archaeon]